MDQCTFVCKRCGYTASSKACLKQHLQRRKYTCPPLLQNIDVHILLKEVFPLKEKTHKCIGCNRCFAHSSTRYKHESSCEQAQQEKQKKKTMSDYSTETSLNLALSQTPGHQTSPPIQVVDCSPINIKALGNEDLSFLQEDKNKTQNMIKMCVLESINGVRRFLNVKHFPKCFKENHNLRKRAKKDNVMEYFDGTQWRLGRCNEILDKVFAFMGRDFAQYPVNDNILYNTEFQTALKLFNKEVVFPLGWQGNNWMTLPLSLSPSSLQKTNAMYKRKIFRQIKAEIYFNTINKN